MNYRKLKFLYLSSEKFTPARVDVAVLFGKEIIQRGHHIDFIFQSKGDARRNYTTKWFGARAFIGATDNGNNKVHRFLKHCLDIINDLRLVKLAIKEGYDFIQVQDKFIAALIGILISKITKCKFFFWLSYPFPEADIYEYKTSTARYPYLYFMRGIIFKILLYEIILPFSDHIFVQSEQMKKDIMLQGIPDYKLTPVPMGVDLDEISVTFYSDQTQEKRAKKTLIYLGTMQKVRRIDFVIRMFRKVLCKIPDVILYMVGGSENSDDLDYLKKEAKRLKVDHATIFTGNLSRNKALQFVKKASVGISPFYPTPILNSTSPTKLIEYMSMGTPVVANDHPEQRQVIEESNAGIYVRYDENAFAGAILKILNNQKKAKQMGINGKEYILNKRNYAVIADLLENKYLQLLDAATTRMNTKSESIYQFRKSI